MKIVVIRRYFENVPESDSVIFNLDLCTTPDEIKFRDEIDHAISNNIEDIYNPSEETMDILVGKDSNSYRKLNFLNGMESQDVDNSTIQYGPTVFIN